MGQQAQFQISSMMKQAIRLVITVENAEEHKQMVGGSRKVFASRNSLRNQVRIRGEDRIYNCGSSNIHSRQGDQ